MANELGKEIRIEDSAEWRTAVPRPGQVLEVELSGTHLNVSEETWGAFMVVSTFIGPHNSLTVVVRYLGCEGVAAGEELEGQALIRPLHVHLCPDAGCIAHLEEQPCVIHARVIRLWAWESFREGGYLNHFNKIAGDVWIQELVSEVLEAADPERPAPEEAEKPAKGAKPSGKATAKRAARPKAGETKPKKRPAAKAGDAGGDGKTDAGAGTGRALTEELKQRLRRRLRAAREGGKDPGGEDGSFELVGDVQQVSDEAEDEESSMPDSEEVQALDSGAMLGEAALRAHAGKAKAVKPTAAIKDGTTRGLETQLIQKALRKNKDRGRTMKRKKDSSREKKDGGAAALAKALQMVLKGTKKGKKKKRGKVAGSGRKKKKKRRVRLKDGQIVSVTDSSSVSSSGDEPEASLESVDEFEAPLKKKSQELTSGVKIMTYFQLHIKGQRQGYLQEMRELHHLAASIDRLRRGDLGTTGDSLAARFIAVHQSILGAGWSTARHMELNPMEDNSAASTAMLLATRKHAKLVAKSQGQQYMPGFGRGRGKGGRGDWQQSTEYRNDYKGEKGKSKKGKTKGRGKTYQQEWMPSGTEWAKSKEKPEEKTA